MKISTVLLGDKSVMIGSHNACSDDTVRSFMKKSVGGWECLQCGFLATANKVYQHVEANHVTVTFSCYLCNNIFKNRATLLKHRSNHHRNDVARVNRGLRLVPVHLREACSPFPNTG